MMLLNIETFFGRFHPLIVHLPIGFLLLAVFFYLLSRRKKYESLRVAVPAGLLIGSLAAAFACMTGYVLSLTGNYDLSTLNSHLQFGIITTILSFLAYLVSTKKLPLLMFRSAALLMILVVLIFILVNYTGHLGGTLTHGGEYLSPAVLFNKPEAGKKMTGLNDVYVFNDLVKPILEEKCMGCHNDSKKNGGLSMATIGSMLKGGKHGTGVKPGNLSGSEIIKRISLLPTSKKFMPANGRKPLTWQETELIRWWIEKVAGETDKKLSAVNAPPEMTSYAAAYFGIIRQDATSTYTTVDIKAPPVRQEVLAMLRASGFSVKYLNYKPDILDVTLPSSDSARNIGALLKSLLAVRENILWLNVAGNHVSDVDVEIIGQFPNLERLRVDENPITDKGLIKIAGLSHLQSLNLDGTKVTKDGVSALSKITTLESVYVWNSGIEISGMKVPFKLIGSTGPGVSLDDPTSKKSRVVKE